MHKTVMTNFNGSKITYLFFTILLYLLIFSCKSIEQPVFKTLENIDVQEVSLSTVIIHADAVFDNPNKASINLVGTDLEVEGNDIYLGKVVQQQEIQVTANDEFKIPIVITFPPKKLWQDEGGLLGGLLNALIDRQVNLRIFGAIKLKAAGIPFNLNIDQTKLVNITK